VRAAARKEYFTILPFGDGGLPERPPCAENISPIGVIRQAINHNKKAAELSLGGLVLGAAVSGDRNFQPFAQGLERGLDCIDLGRMAGIQESIDLGAVDVQPPGKVSLAHALSNHLIGKKNLGRYQSRELNSHLSALWLGWLRDFPSLVKVDLERALKRFRSESDNITSSGRGRDCFRYIREGNQQLPVAVQLGFYRIRVHMDSIPCTEVHESELEKQPFRATSLISIRVVS
jgi:hypothetical protein